MLVAGAGGLGRRGAFYLEHDIVGDDVSFDGKRLKSSGQLDGHTLDIMAVEQLFNLLQRLVVGAIPNHVEEIFTEQVANCQAEKTRGVETCLNNAPAARIDYEQSAMRLNRARDLDWFALAAC